MGKDILYLTTRLPYPTVGGDRLRIYNILKQLKLNGHRITLVSLVTPEDDLQGCLQDGSFFDRLIPIKFNKKLAYVNFIVEKCKIWLMLSLKMNILILLVVI